jgi:hypothetical protein
MSNTERLILVAVVALLGLLIWGAVVESRQWSEFRVAHNCKVVGKTSPSTGVGFGMGGNGQMGTVIATTPGKTGWLCDDGVTYWR